MTARIVEFLRVIGIAVEPADLDPEECFLPGLRLDRGRLLYDEEALAYPGDLLHEAGHIAVAPPGARELLSGAADVPGLDMGRLEHAAVAWSYAAALEVGIDPALVFHEGGYRGKGRRLLGTYSVGVYPGANLLEESGMAASPARAAELGVDPYPHMIEWVRSR